MISHSQQLSAQIWIPLPIKKNMKPAVIRLNYQLLIQIHLVLETIKTIGVNAELDFYMEYQWFDQREVKEDIFLSGRKTDTYSWLPDVYFLLARNVSQRLKVGSFPFVPPSA